jgi:hypothetical protein
VKVPVVPAGTRVDLSTVPGDGSVSVRICGLRQPVVIEATGGAELTAKGVLALEQRARLFLAPPGVAADRADGPDERCALADELRLSFLPANGALELHPELTVKSLKLYSERRGPDGSVEPESTLLKGKIQLGSVKAAPRILQRSEFVDPVSAKGRLRTARLTTGSVEFTFEGTVEDIRIGPPFMQESVMPTMLEWWLSQDRLWVAWSAGLTLLGLVLGLHRWLGRAA